jgi:hypothetical protein
VSRKEVGPHLTPWGAPLSWTDRISDVALHEAVYHRRFGMGLVTACKPVEGIENLIVRFKEHGLRWVIPGTAPMCRMPQTELAARRERGEAWCQLPEPAKPDFSASWTGLTLCSIDTYPLLESRLMTKLRRRL